MAGIVDNKLVMVILCIFLPPVAVAIKDGITLHFWINLALTLLLFWLWLPALIHALWRILR